MNEAKLLINSEKEFELIDEIITIGRASDNMVSFPEDSNVSRYHAEIEKRGDNEYWIFDLNSSNGTTLNGEKVITEKPLYDGDVIVFGGTSEIQVLLSPEENSEPEEEEKESDSAQKEPEAKESEEQQEPPQKSAKGLLLLTVAGLAIGLAVICVFAAGIYYWKKSSESAAGCQAQATIVNPQDGDILKKEEDIEIDLKNGECVAEVVFLMDDEAFISSKSAPFSAKLNPDKFPNRSADGLDNKLKLVLLDENEKQIFQSDEVTIALQTVKTQKPENTDNGNGDPEGGLETGGEITTAPTQDSNMSLIDTQKMTSKVIPQFAGSFEYKANNESFLRAVRQMTTEYASAGYFERAQKYSDIIAKEYIQNRNLDPPLGFILAMSRTKFIPANQTDGAGLWNMDNNLVMENGYNGPCKSETIASPVQKCASIASSTYIKDIVRDVFEGDIIYGIAAFGMTKNEAAEWKATLPPPNQRKDFWNVITSKKQRDEIVRFFAAATVAENPQKFGLKNDRPLSELYKIYMD